MQLWWDSRSDGSDTTGRGCRRSFLLSSLVQMGPLLSRRTTGCGPLLSSPSPLLSLRALLSSPSPLLSLRATAAGLFSPDRDRKPSSVLSPAPLRSSQTLPLRRPSSQRLCSRGVSSPARRSRPLLSRSGPQTVLSSSGRPPSDRDLKQTAFSTWVFYLVEQREQHQEKEKKKKKGAFSLEPGATWVFSPRKISLNTCCRVDHQPETEGGDFLGWTAKMERRKPRMMRFWAGSQLP